MQKRQNLYRYFKAHEQSHLRAYRRGQVTLGEYQHCACLAAIAAYSLERPRRGSPPRWRLPAALRAFRVVREALASLGWRLCPT